MNNSGVKNLGEKISDVNNLGVNIPRSSFDGLGHFSNETVLFLFIFLFVFFFILTDIKPTQNISVKFFGYFFVVK